MFLYLDSARPQSACHVPELGCCSCTGERSFGRFPRCGCPKRGLSSCTAPAQCGSTINGCVSCRSEGGKSRRMRRPSEGQKETDIQQIFQSSSSNRFTRWRDRTVQLRKRRTRKNHCSFVWPHTSAAIRAVPNRISSLPPRGFSHQQLSELLQVPRRRCTVSFSWPKEC